ncbi:hypothetical protein BV20DRAFT_661133 [Pilatotrama ljubarskyi]|nr:hypothetical protein BV20DRAFT_661133 [Pilatotrama ljubarskyi]
MPYWDSRQECTTPGRSSLLRKTSTCQASRPDVKAQWTSHYGMSAKQPAHRVSHGMRQEGAGGSPSFVPKGESSAIPTSSPNASRVNEHLRRIITSQKNKSSVPPMRGLQCVRDKWREVGRLLCRGCACAAPTYLQPARYVRDTSRHPPPANHSNDRNFIHTCLDNYLCSRYEEGTERNTILTQAVEQNGRKRCANLGEQTTGPTSTAKWALALRAASSSATRKREKREQQTSNVDAWSPDHHTHQDLRA